MKKFGIFFMLIFLSAAFLPVSAKHGDPVRKKDSPIDTVKTVLPKTVEIKAVNDIWNKAVDKNGNLLGYVFNSLVYGVDIFGYWEDVPTLVITDKNQKILKVSVINSYETDSYLSKIRSKGFFKKWNGTTIQSAKNVKVDAVSGATLTSEAVMDNMKLISEKAIQSQPK